MRKYMYGAALVAVLALVAGPAFAQQTTGSITGRVLDQQGAAVPGATVTAKNPQTGFTRTAVSDGAGVYQLTGLPVGVFDVTSELSGFTTMEKKAIEVNVAQIVTIDFDLKVAQLAETVTVTGATPLIETAASSVGGVVDLRRVENMPLNGRQFANLAVTIPGVSMGFHSDPTKSTQFSPQINGGNGRNVNYQIDGGDNNDDTVGGLLQQFPLEAIREFNFITARYKAEYGRSNGGVMNIVTKSGTNNNAGSWFTFLRDKSLNAVTETERLAGLRAGKEPTKQDYRRYQYGGSFGGPIVRDRTHYFAAYERTQQDTNQTVTTLGLFPELDGVYGTPYRENLLTGKMTHSVGNHYLSVRYGRNDNSQPYDAARLHPPSNWGDSINKFNSINLNYNLVLGGSKLNEFIFQYADFRNHIAAGSNQPNESFPNGVTVGQNGNTPQTTEQKKWQFRDDFSWHVTGMGLGHDFKAGVNLIHEPHLFITFNTGKGVVFSSHLTNDRNGPIQTVSLSDGDADANIPTKQYSAYFQDDWRVTARVTLNLGVRYDLVDGMQFDQSKNPNFVTIQKAAQAGVLQGIVGLENFGQEQKEDTNNIQPRLGMAWDLRGNGKDVVRAGWGIYADFGYTNANGLFAAADSTGRGFGAVFNATNPAGLRNPDGSFYRVGQPLSNLASQNEVTPGGFTVFGQYVDPRLEQPETWQTAVGWSHEINPTTVFNVDLVRNLGKKLNIRSQVNQRITGTTTRRVQARLTPIGLSLTPNTVGNRPAVSRGESEYTGLIMSVRRRMSGRLDYGASYTLSDSKSNIGSAVDELNAGNIQDPNNPFDDPRQVGPTTRTDARHRLSFSALIRLPGDVSVAPIFTTRSSLPVALFYGRDLNLDGNTNDIPAKAFAFDKYNDDGTWTVKEIGDCKTINCGRGAPFSQMNLRVSKMFNLGARVRAEAIGEVFNLLNARNPTGFRARVFLPTGPDGVRDPDLLGPTAFPGDFQQPEQRVGQFGFRITF